MTNWISIGQHVFNLDHIDRISFPDEHTTLIFFNSLESRHCEECGEEAAGLEKAWFVLGGEEAVLLRRYMSGIAADARTPVPAVFHQPTP